MTDFTMPVATIQLLFPQTLPLTQLLVGASLSEPHTSVTALRTRVYV